MGEQTAASLVRASFPEAVAERRFLTFRVADQCYALPGEEVSEIILIPPVARLPHSPKSLMGLANLRGSVLPMIDLRSLLGRGAFTQSVNSAGRRYRGRARGAEDRTGRNPTDGIGGGAG